MMIKQLSIFLENKKGRLAQVTSTLAKNKINIRALSLADSADFGVLRLIVNDPDRGATSLKKAGMVVQVTDVIAVEISDKPGGLSRVLHLFDRGAINVEYMYAFVEKIKDKAVVIFKIEQPASAIKILKKEGMPLVRSSVLKGL
ncbi:MAG: amino acid-binding protein [Lentisphaerae bacterium RIFOXYA12_FULL_48_11]|nr:MAG: amino acid-binding protein [Lentisphaerae bacterium RIFOXYA12_FULL_48_11]